MPDIPAGSMLPWQWAEDAPSSRHGDGISRPRPGARTREFCVLITTKGARQLKWYTRAETKTKARDYAIARWPDADVEVA